MTIAWSIQQLQAAPKLAACAATRNVSRDSAAAWGHSTHVAQHLARGAKRHCHPLFQHCKLCSEGFKLKDSGLCASTCCYTCRQVYMHCGSHFAPKPVLVSTMLHHVACSSYTCLPCLTVLQPASNRFNPYAHIALLQL